MKLSTKRCILIIAVILGLGYFYDINIFKGLLTWLLGGAIMLLLNVAFFGDLIKKVMENNEVQDFISLFREASKRLKEILENQKNGQ